MNRLRVREHRLRKRIAEGKDPIPMDKWEACMPGVAARQAKRAALWREQQAKAAAAQAPAETGPECAPQ
jgi:hypothetical protein